MKESCRIHKKKRHTTHESERREEMVVRNIKMEDITTALRKELSALGGKYAEYQTAEVSWDDVLRHTEGGKPLFSGPNIMDSRIFLDDGRQAVFTRPQNLNERVGKVSASDVSLLRDTGEFLEAVTLSDFLKNIGQEAKYNGVDPSVDLSDATKDLTVGVRFQTVFLPTPFGEEGAVEFHPEVYSYGSMLSPQNLLIVCTSQGSAIQYPGAGQTPLYHHCQHDDGSYHKHTLSAQKTRFNVGGSQEETEEEREYNEKNNRASAMHIGLRQMGSRMNALMVIQVPLKQTAPPVHGTSYQYLPTWDMESDEPVYKSLSAGASPMTTLNFRGGCFEAWVT